MKKFTKAIAALMLTVAVFLSACTKDPENGGNNNGGGNGGGSTPTVPTEEGMYLGIIGFNEQLNQKPISLLNNSTKASFKTFIENLRTADGTALYYADYTALKELQAYSEPPALSKVALVTFTDGLDNLSTSGSIMNPESYGSIAAYRTALHNKIINDRIHGKTVSAYTIGLRGADVQNNLTEFQTNLEMLASRPKVDYVFEVGNMTEALERFRKIAEDLYHSVTTVNLRLKLPGGLDDGLVVRFTFDDVSDGGSSSKYVQCTYKRTSDNGRRLESISYHGFNAGASSLNPVSQTETGTFHWFEFEGLSHSNGNAITQYDINRLQLWKKQGSVWQRDSEFTPGSSSEVTETKTSALIVLVLDCTTSLGDDFRSMQAGAKQFVEALCSSNTGGGTSGGEYSPTVTTSNVTDISFTSAKCGGTAILNGGPNITSRGVCWSTNPNPTISDSYTYEGSGVGSFTSNITGLEQGTRYYVRAYATNSAGTSYGSQRTFTTTASSAPTGAINGKFTVNSSGGKVYFSKGNLQYKASTGTWQFAANQYDYIGSANSNISSSYSGWIDLFGWGTSGWNCGNTYYRPWDSANGNGSLYGPPGSYNLTGSYANSDWGYYNAISNGGNATHQWRTLTKDEWVYVFNTRSTASGIRYAKAKVNNKDGVILLPDDWSASYYSLSSTNNSGASFSSNVISSSDWTNNLQSHGAVFLPAAGYRSGASVYGAGSDGFYWSASYYNSYFAYYVYFYASYLNAADNYYRYFGLSVRLVCPAEN